jgi:hypothetical protein
MTATGRYPENERVRLLSRHGTDWASASLDSPGCGEEPAEAYRY